MPPAELPALVDQTRPELEPIAKRPEVARIQTRPGTWFPSRRSHDGRFISFQ
jgi:hypothetical protein